MNTVNLLSFVSKIKSFGGIVLAIVILLAMVTVHEFGHYVAGKILGFKINEFSVGFGPALFKKRSKKTGEVFALRIIPLGGYCAFDGEDDFEEETPKKEEEPFPEWTKKSETVEKDGGKYGTNEESAEKSVADEYPEPKGEKFNDQPPWKRIIVLIAGALMNYLLAVFLIIAMFSTVGRPTYQVIKIEPPAENPHQNAVETYESGLQTGDIILEINGKSMYLLTDYTKVLDGKSKGDVVNVLVLREGKEITVPVTLFENVNIKNMSDSDSVLFSLGIAARGEVEQDDGSLVLQTVRGGGLSTTTVKDGFFETIGRSFVYSFKIGGTILRSLGELLTGKLGISSMGGPVTTITVTSQAASSGWLSFLNISAFIGVNLAVFNLLPIPALDGCKVIFCLIEWIRKKPVNRKVETIIHFIGIIFLLGFAVLVDLLQLF